MMSYSVTSIDSGTSRVVAVAAATAVLVTSSNSITIKLHTTGLKTMAANNEIRLTDFHIFYVPCGWHKGMQQVRRGVHRIEQVRNICMDLLIMTAWHTYDSADFPRYKSFT